MALALAIAASVAFAVTNGFHDAANAIATLVATRGARPGPAVALSATGNLLGAVLVGGAVAATIGGIVQVPGAAAVPVIGAGVIAATAWNVVTWRLGLPSSSAHALVGGLVGSAIAAEGVDAVQWGGMDGLRPVGVVGVLIALAVSPAIGFAAALAIARLNRRILRRATVAVQEPIRRCGVGHVGGAVVQPWRQRRAEGDGRDRRAAAGQRSRQRRWPCRCGRRSSAARR